MINIFQESNINTSYNPDESADKYKDNYIELFEFSAQLDV